MEQLAEVNVICCQPHDPAMFEVFLRKVSDIQLHYFSDAFIHGYAEVGYLRLLDNVGKVHCAFVMGKTRNSL